MSTFIEHQKSLILNYHLTGQAFNTVLSLPRLSGKTTALLELGKFCKKMSIPYLFSTRYPSQFDPLKVPNILEKELRHYLHGSWKFRGIKMPEKLVVLCDEYRAPSSIYTSISLFTPPL